MALNHKIHLLWGFLFAIVACTGNELLPSENYNGNKSTNSQNIQRSEEEALHIANTFFQEKKISHALQQRVFFLQKHELSHLK